MKIIQIGPVTPEYGGSHVGGIATHLTQFVKALDQKKISCLILTASKRDYSKGCIDVIGMSSKINLIKLVTRNPVFFVKSFFNKGKQGLIQAAYESYIKSRFSADEVVIHVHSLHCGFADNLLDEYKVVYTDHGFWQKEGGCKAIKKRIEKSVRIISVSNYAKLKLAERFTAASTKTSVVYNPINIPSDEELLSPSDIDASRKIIFFNGYSESLKRKGLDLLAESTIPSLSSENFELIVDSEGKEYLESRAINNVKIHTKLPYSQVSKLYQQSKLMVLPSRSESFGLVYIESASYGVPVVGFKPMIDEFNRYLEMDIGLGFSAETQSADELKLLVVKALDINWNSKKMREVVESKFSWELLSSKFINIYLNANKW